MCWDILNHHSPWVRVKCSNCFLISFWNISIVCQWCIHICMYYQKQGWWSAIVTTSEANNQSTFVHFVLHFSLLVLSFKLSYSFWFLVMTFSKKNHILFFFFDLFFWITVLLIWMAIHFGAFISWGSKWHLVEKCLLLNVASNM